MKKALCTLFSGTALFGLCIACGNIGNAAADFIAYLILPTGVMLSIVGAVLTIAKAVSRYE